MYFDLIPDLDRRCLVNWPRCTLPMFPKRVPARSAKPSVPCLDRPKYSLACAGWTLSQAPQRAAPSETRRCGSWCAVTCLTPLSGARFSVKGWCPTATCRDIHHAAARTGARGALPECPAGEEPWISKSGPTRTFSAKSLLRQQLLAQNHSACAAGWSYTTPRTTSCSVPGLAPSDVRPCALAVAPGTLASFGL